VVSNEEIKQMLEAKRRGIKIEDDQNKSEHYNLCPQCKTKNPRKAIFCVNCGNKLDKNLTIKCPSCGSENTKNAKFCIGCGKKLDQTQETEPLKVKPKLQPIENKGNDVNFSEPKKESEPLNKTPETQEDPIPKAPISSNVPEHDPIPKNDSKKVCPACNGKNLITAKFCVVCGKNFDKEDTSSNLPNETEEKTKTRAITPEIKVPKGILNTNKKYETKRKSNKESGLISSEAPETGTTYNDPVEKIKKSKELLDMGAITSEEFEHIKKKYLEQI
jgi:predicted amidophosphoribosyltransferase